MSSTRIGTTVGGYRLERLLGRGGMSVVYLAEHIRLGRKVALKVLSSALSADEAFRQRFEGESRRAAEVDHPNVIPIYDAGDADGELYIAMRYVRGADLKTMIARDGPLNIGRSLFILEQAAAGLDAAHERELVHRDVKPANILVEEPSDRVFVSDFGVVKHTASPGVTKTGFFVGTADYAAPEQLEGLAVDRRTDVYALGCVLYETLTGRPPFHREAEVAVMHAHLTEPPPAVTAVRADLAAAIDTVIARAMAKAREERYETCSELISAARAAILQQPVAEQAPRPAGKVAPAAVGAEELESAPEPAPTPVDPAPQPPAPPAAGGRSQPAPARWWAIVAASSLLAAAIAAVVVFLATRSDDVEPRAEPTVVTVTTPGEPAPAQPPPAAVPPEPVPAVPEPEPAPPEPAPVAPEPEPAPPPPAPATPEERLESVVPVEIWESCELTEPTTPDAIVAAACDLSSTLRGSPPESLELMLFPDDSSLAAAYETLKSEHARARERDTGRCNLNTWDGERQWNHGPDRLGGRNFCYLEGGDNATMVWMHVRRGQDDHEQTLLIAQQGNLTFKNLRRWWDANVDEIGRRECAGCP